MTFNLKKIAAIGGILIANSFFANAQLENKPLNVEAYSQCKSESNPLTQLDTIIYTKHELLSHPSDAISTYTQDNKVYYCNSKNLKNRQFTIYILNLLDNTIDSIEICQPKKAINPYAKQIVVNSDYLIISGYTESAIFKLDPVSKKFSYDHSISYEKYYDLNINENLLYLTYAYNYYSDSDKSGFGVYNLIEKKWLTKTKLMTNGIYFSHLTPSKLLTFHGNLLLQLDPVNYSIKLLDTSSQIICEYTRNLSGWKTLDSTIQTQLKDTSNHLYAKEVISILNRHRLNIDRCQEIISLNKDTFLVSYYRIDPTTAQINYYIDFYSSVNNKIHLYKSSICDLTLNTPELRIDANYPSMHTFNSHIFSNNKIVVFKNLAEYRYYEKTLEEISRAEEIFFEKQNGSLGFFIFDLKK